MNTLTLHPLDLTSDLEWLTGLGNEHRSEPYSADTVREWIEHQRPGRDCRITVAMDASGARAGYNEAIHETWYPAGQYKLWVQVEPRFQRQGIGAALYADALAYARSQGAKRLISEVSDACLPCLEFAAQRGFTIERHIFESVLDLETFDETPYLPQLASLEAEGLSFASLADLGCTPEAKAQLYQINRAVVLDIPGMEGDFIPYDQFEQLVIGADWFNPAGQFLAALGEVWVGMVAVRLIPEKQGAYNLITGVLAPYRGRKIALAMKIHANRYACAHGARYLRTNNDSLNAPMLAINRKLGYQPEPGLYRLRAEPEGENG
jgi:GNAT superfamily N-acetyltransferase